jgi:hypothetical protein
MALVILPENPQDEWDLGDWVEMMAQQKPGGAGGFSHQASEDTLVITLQGNQIRSALRQLLGWAWSDVAAPWRLHRPQVAVQHPRLPWLWAAEASVQPHNPLGQLQADGTYKAKTAGVGFDGYAPGSHGCYARMDVAVKFRGVNWMQWKDDDPQWADNFAGKEWLRSVGVMNKSVMLDLVSAEGANDEASFYFAEGVTGGAGAGPVTGDGGTPFNGTQYVRAQRTTFRLVWKCVPLEYTCGEMEFNEADIASFMMPYPERLIKALGRVNSAAFPGSASPYAAGTLLLTSVEEIPYQLPVRTNTEFGAWCADYVLTFEHFDPARDPNAVANYGSGGVVSLKRGHYLFPYRPTGLWYYATAGNQFNRGTYSGTAPLLSQDFHDLFRHRGDTANFPLPNP